MRGMGEKATTKSGPGGARAGAGRPTLYSQAIVDEVIRLMVDEDMNLWRISKREGMPVYSTFWRWMAEHADFESAYRRAEQVRAHHVQHDIERLELKVLKGTVTPQQAAALTNMKRWRAKVMNPRVFGDVTRAEVSGPSGGPIEVKDEAATSARIASLVQLALMRRDNAVVTDEIDLAS
jgi:hypothetical protein